MFDLFYNIEYDRGYVVAKVSIERSLYARRKMFSINWKNNERQADIGDWTCITDSKSHENCIGTVRAVS